jgi:hypothetical protein
VLSRSFVVYLMSKPSISLLHSTKNFGVGAFLTFDMEQENSLLPSPSFLEASQVYIGLI